MEEVAVFIVVASVLLALFAIVNLVKPLGLARIRRRQDAAAVLGGSAILLFAGGMLGAIAQSGALNASKVATDRDGAAPMPAAAAANPPAGVTQIEFEAIWGSTKVIMDRCDGQLRRVSDALRGGDIYDAYSVVQRAKQECSRTPSLMDRIEIPEAAREDVRSSLKKAIGACGETVTIKSEAMDKVATFLDGDGRASLFDAAQADMQRARLAMLQCVGQFGKAADTAGLVLPELAGDKTQTTGD